MQRGFFSDIVLCLCLEQFWPLLQFLNLIKYFLICSIQTAYFEEFCFFITWIARNLVHEALNQWKMIFWFNHEKIIWKIKQITRVSPTWSSIGTAESKCCEIDLINKMTKIKYLDEILDSHIVHKKFLITRN